MYSKASYADMLEHDQELEDIERRAEEKGEQDSDYERGN